MTARAGRTAVGSDDTIDLDKAVRENAGRTVAGAADLPRQLSPALEVSSHAAAGDPVAVVRQG